MDADTLERLMLDRGLDALPPDCGALLDAYLATDSAAARLNREVSETIELARLALRSDETLSLPAFPAERLVRSRRRVRTWRMVRNVTGLAAAILVGFAIRGFVPASRPQPAPPLQQFVFAPDVPARQPANETQNGFWSTRRLYERATVVREQPQLRSIWRTPALLLQRGDSI